MLSENIKRIRKEKGLSLIIAAVVVAVFIYLSAWAIIVSVWAIFTALAVTCIACLVAAFYFLFTHFFLSGIALLSAALVCAGLSIFAFFGCKFATITIFLLTKKFLLWVKSYLNQKEEAK